ncbi:hypothetical protein MSAN_00299400 [Mycena sanguinolenta]|uniref:Protein kinase domain-containing protein n=1 Tax=Mycena sanguinolenta TaxID=230812 RepID=A0A8H6ZC58_9AGAR|nr:hypothetical protein MSAN_00299400 [Mycena sanguinolenta]
MHNSETHADADFNPVSTGDNAGSTSYGGAIFPGSQHFTVAGGTFTNITKNYSTAPTVSPDFRKILMSDVDLQREIRLDKPSGVVSLRRLYSAKIEHGTSSVARTVAVYQGDEAEQEWRHDIAKYMAVRHPNIVQLWGTASCGNIHAAVFNDDLIPFQQFADLYRHSHFTTVYIHAYVVRGCYSAFFKTIFGHPLRDHNCTFFIRRSTGRFCADLVPGGTDPLYYTYGSNEMSQQGLEFLAGENSEITIINTLTLHQYHSICYWGASVTRSMSFSTSQPVKIGSVFNCGLENLFDDIVEIAWLPNIKLSQHVGWENEGCGYGKLMANGWTRFNLDDAVADEFSIGLWLDKNDFWLSQAHHIFTSLQVVSNYHDYGMIGPSSCIITDILPLQQFFLEHVVYTLTISPSRAKTKGFLFLCPWEHFQTGTCSVKWPEYPSYFSLNPLGIEPLTSEDAATLGFPSVRYSTRLEGKSWNATVYAGLCQFHQAKGFDPDTQDVARHLGHKLYQLSVPFAHIDDEYYSNTRDGDETSLYSAYGELDDLESTLMDPVRGHIAAAFSQDAEEGPVFSAFEDTVDPTSVNFAADRTHNVVVDNSSIARVLTGTIASTALRPNNGPRGGSLSLPVAWMSTRLLPTNREDLAAGIGYGYGYDIQPNPYPSTSDFNFDPNFNAYNFGNDLSWLNDPVFNDTVPSASLNDQPPMLRGAAQFFPAAPLPQLPTSLPDAPFVPVIDAPVVDSPFTTSKKRKTRDETGLLNIVQGTRAQKAPKYFHIDRFLM